MKLLKTHPARVYALVVAVLGLLVAFGVHVPETSILGVVTAVLALVSGEVVQRTEDSKTADALAAQPETRADMVGE